MLDLKRLVISRGDEQRRIGDSEQYSALVCDPDACSEMDAELEKAEREEIELKEIGLKEVELKNVELQRKIPVAY